MVEIEHWLPTVVNAGLIVLFWFFIRSTYIKMEQKEREITEKYISETTHGLICETNTLKIQKCFSEEMKKLKDEIFKKLRKIEEHILKEEGRHEAEMQKHKSEM